MGKINRFVGHFSGASRQTSGPDTAVSLGMMLITSCDADGSAARLGIGIVGVGMWSHSERGTAGSLPPSWAATG